MSVMFFDSTCKSYYDIAVRITFGFRRHRNYFDIVRFTRVSKKTAVVSDSIIIGKVFRFPNVFSELNYNVDCSEN